MKTMKRVAAGLVMAGLAGVPVWAQASQGAKDKAILTEEASLSQTAEHTAQQRAAAAQEPGQSISSPADGVAHSWTPEQLVTCSVHEAWVLSGRNEDQFFEMVKQLSAMSAQKRGLTLPETQEAGVKAGNWIKKQAKRDPDQLLYAVVDRAVAKVGVKAPAVTK